jgi:hypothetical protein
MFLTTMRLLILLERVLMGLLRMNCSDDADLDPLCIGQVDKRSR